MRILLATLPREGETKDYTTREYLLTDFSRLLPLGLLAIAADVNPKHSIQVLDVTVKNMTIDDTVRYVEDYRPDVLGISVATRRLYPMHEVASRVKRSLPDTRIVVGGPHVNYWPHETMQLRPLDYVLPGYGEKAFPLLIDAIDDGESEAFLKSVPSLYYRSADGDILSNPREEMPTVLDSLPFPDRRLINLDDYFSAVDRARTTTLYSSRGCPFRCIFCDVQEKKFSYRTANSVVDEFEEIVALGFGEVYILDDTFNANRQRVIDICEEILRRGIRIRWSTRARVAPFDREMMRLMKEAGCTRLHVGVESLDPATLKYMGKGQTLEQIQSFFSLCRELHMETLGYFIIGFPEETREYRKTLLDQVLKLHPTYAFCNILYPLAKTQYYKSLLENGTFQEDYWAGFLKNPTRAYELPLPRSRELQHELEAVADEFHRKFCFRPEFILREFRKTLRNPRMLLQKAKLAVLLLIRTGEGKRANKRETVSDRLVMNGQR